VRQPGAKFDEMMILEGDQGIAKSTALATLAVREEWFSDSVRLDVSDREMIESTSGIWICEYGELQGIKKAEVEKIKAQLSRSRDRARLAYGRLPISVPRQSVAAGTTNAGKAGRYLMDGTGNRRFWPVEVRRCDVEALLRDRDQLWAEAVSREGFGASIRLPESLWLAAAEEQKARAVDNPFADILARALGDKEGWIRAIDLWDVLGIPATLRNMHGSRFGEAMLSLGWTKHNWRIKGAQTNLYAKGVIDSSNGELKVITRYWPHEETIVVPVNYPPAAADYPDEDTEGHTEENTEE
jgi:predicted P-loop ATPase